MLKLLVSWSVATAAILTLVGCATTTTLIGTDPTDGPVAVRDCSGELAVLNAKNVGDKGLVRADALRCGSLDSAKQYFRSGYYGLAEGAYRRAIEQAGTGDGPANRRSLFEAWLGLAASYDRLSNFEKADIAYRHIRDEFGESAIYLNNYGFSMRLRGRAKDAQVLFERAQKLSPSNPVIGGNMQGSI